MLLLSAVFSAEAVAQAGSIVDLKGRWQLLPVITKKHCYTDRQVGFIQIGKAVGDETFGATAWLRFIRSPTNAPGCSTKHEDVHDVVAIEISTYGEHGTTNRYVIRYRKSLRQRAYNDQTWLYLNGRLRAVGPDGKPGATMVRRTCWPVTLLPVTRLPVARPPVRRRPVTRQPAVAGDPCQGPRK